MKFEVHKIHIWRPTLSSDMVQWVLWWERQKMCFGRKGKDMVEKYYYNEFLMIFFKEEEDEDKRRQKNDQT